MIHEVRSNYGWTDDYILDNTEVYGTEWLKKNWELCREGFRDKASLLSMLIPMARTPMDKKSARGMQTYAKSVQKSLDSIAPWSGNSRYRNRKRAFEKKGIKPGEMVVVSGPGERTDIALFEGMKVVKDI